MNISKRNKHKAAMFNDMLKMYKSLLNESMSYYEFYPNNHRMSAEEYFASDIQFIKDAEAIK